MKKRLWGVGMVIGLVIAAYGLYHWGLLGFPIPLKTNPEAPQSGDVFLILLGGGIFANAFFKFKGL